MAADFTKPARDGASEGTSPDQGYGQTPGYGQPQGYGAVEPYGAPGYGSPEGYGAPAYGAPGYGSPQGYGAPAYGAPAGYGGGYGQPPMGPPGQVRGTGFGILMTIITFGIYPLYWYFVVHEEMKRHSGTGLGGGIALIIAFFVTPAMPFISSSEVGALHTRRGQQAPVSGITGLWYFPGMFILVGPLIWWVKTNGALNDYWRSVGAR